VFSKIIEQETSYVYFMKNDFVHGPLPSHNSLRKCEIT
jgi:hypothetical protein